MQKKIMIIVLSVLCQWTFAETCPDIKTIKTHLPIGWKLYDSENNSLLSSQQIIEFKNAAAQFTLAEWIHRDQHGMIRCYYMNDTGSHLTAYLGKDDFDLENTHHYWYQVTGSMHCAAGMTKCEFQQHTNAFNKIKSPRSFVHSHQNNIDTNQVSV